MKLARKGIDVAVTLCVLAGLSFCAGCRQFDHSASKAIAETSEESIASRPKEKASSSPVPPAPLTSVDRAVLAKITERDAKNLAGCVWIRSVDEESETRWRYPQLDDVLSRPVEKRPDLRLVLADSDANVSANAAIALAQRGDAAGLDRLAELVRTPNVPLPMRCAAVEAIGMLPKVEKPLAEAETASTKKAKKSADAEAMRSDEVTLRLQELVDQYGTVRKDKKSPYMAELHAELIRALAKRESPSDDVRFVQALRAMRPEPRLEALLAWERCEKGELPVEAVDLRADPDYRVRGQALRTMAAKKHPAAFTHAKSALHDADFRVRSSAIAGLGLIGDEESKELLKELIVDRAEPTRLAAVAALVECKFEKPLWEASGDASWRVRQKIAQALSRFPNAEAAAVAERFLQDPSVEVQLAVVRAVDSWPIERKGPILLMAMGDKSTYNARRTAARELADAWKPAESFPFDGPPERRAEILATLVSRFRDERPDAYVVASKPKEAPVARPHASDSQLAEIERFLKTENRGELRAYGPELLDALERLRFERKALIPDWVYSETLPARNTTFAAIDRLSSSDASQRRKAAYDLVEIAEKGPIGRFAFDRLCFVVTPDKTAVVWQAALKIAEKEGGDSARELTYVALSQDDPETKRLACELLVSIPDSRNAALLLPLLEGSNHDVTCSALRALAVSGTTETLPIRKLLASTNEEIQYEAAAALVALNDESGKTALARLAYARDPKVAAHAAQKMGEYPDPFFTAALVELLDGKTIVVRAALESLPKIVGDDVSLRKDDRKLPSTSERILRWKQWYERQASAPRDKQTK